MAVVVDSLVLSHQLHTTCDVPMAYLCLCCLFCDGLVPCFLFSLSHYRSDQFEVLMRGSIPPRFCAISEHTLLLLQIIPCQQVSLSSKGSAGRAALSGSRPDRGCSVPTTTVCTARYTRTWALVRVCTAISCLCSDCSVCSCPMSKSNRGCRHLV